jgi:hypothetical protein
MDGPTRRPRHRALAALLKLGAGLAGLALLVALALPLVVRGSVSRWVVGLATRSLCGRVELAGAHAGWAAVFDLMLGRPIPVVVDDLRITGPDGQVVLAAARIEADIAFRRGGRIVVPRVRIAHGRWRLDLDHDGAGTAEAFRKVPPAGRSACLDPHAARSASRSGGGGGALDLQRVELADVDAELTFDTWGLTLAGADAIGSLRAGGGGPVLLFDVRDVAARGGSVRIGGPRSPWRTRVPLDRAAISRVGVYPETPTDLKLEVEGGATGRSFLSGRALFRNIFPAPGGRRPPGPPGLDADVRWTHFGDALARLEAAWRPRGAWLQRIDGDLHALVKGPFNALEGNLDIAGGGTKVAARLAGGAADLRLTLDGVDTTWMVAPPLRPLLAGELQGRFHATAQLAPTFEQIRAQIPDADLRLDRRRAPRGPRRYELRIGASSHRATRNPETLYASIARIRLANGTVDLDQQRISWTGLSAALDAEIAFPAPGRPGSRLDVRGSLAVAALQDWIPDGIATGPLRMDLAAAGRLERVELKLAFPPPSTVAVVGQRFVLPRRLDAVFDADEGLRFSPLQLKRLGGGTLKLGGRIGPGDRLALSAGAQDYPIAALPGLDRAGLPPLAGQLGADLSITGAADRPAVKGHVTVAGLAVARRPIGLLNADLRVTGESGEVTATVDPGVTLRARVRRRGALSVDADVAVQDRPLGPWLPPPLAGAPLRASGHVTLGYRAGAPLTAEADASVTGPGLTGVRLNARLRGADGSGHVAGAVDVAQWPQLWPRQVKSAQGVLDLDVAIRDALIRPRGVGSLKVSRELVVRTAGWPAPVTLGEGGRFDLDGTALKAVDVALSTPGVTARLGGGATLDFDDLDRSALALQLQAQLDATHFPLRLPGRASIAGRVDLTAQVGGTLAGRPGPRVDGRLQMNELTVQLSPATPAAHGRGVIEAHGDLVRTSGLDVRLDGVGVVRIGSPAHPASAVIASLSPFRIGAVDVPFTGTDLTLGTPASELYVPDLDADLRLGGDARRELTVAGSVSIAGGVLDRSKRAPAVLQRKPRAGGGAWWRSLPPHLTLDLELRGLNRGMRVAVPVLPDVTVDFRCRLHATNRGASWSGRLRGDGAWARAAVTVFDWLRPEDLRRCQLTP